MSAIGLAGLGLIGGSLARDLAAAGRRVYGADADRGVVDAARAAGVVAGELGPDIDDLELVVLAVPVRATPLWIRRLAGWRRPDLVVTDTGSTKRSAVAAAAAAGLDGFVGSHPMAGDHRSGWGAARPGLFDGARVWICPGAAAAPDAVAAVERLWTAVGGRPRRIDPGDHDRLLSAASHLPQLAATALALALDRAGVAPDRLGPGGRDATRLAGSDPSMWADILVDNADEVGPALDGLMDQLERLGRAIAAGDADEIRAAVAGGRAWSGRASGRGPTGGD